MEFIDRIEETATFKRTLALKRPVLIVIYGRRRIGKSELIKHVLSEVDVYHLSEEAQIQQQIDSFAKTVSFTFDVIYLTEILLERGSSIPWPIVR